MSSCFSALDAVFDAGYRRYYAKTVGIMVTDRGVVTSKRVECRLYQIHSGTKIKHPGLCSRSLSYLARFPIHFLPLTLSF
jgi:hypothetical protein